MVHCTTGDDASHFPYGDQREVKKGQTQMLYWNVEAIKTYLNRENIGLSRAIWMFFNGLHQYPAPDPFPPTPPPPEAPISRTPLSANPEVSALDKITRFAALQFISIIAITIFIVWLLVTLFGLLNTSAATQQSFDLQSFLSEPYFIILIEAIFAVNLASLIFLRTGLKIFSAVDKPYFSTPAILTLILIIGSILSNAGEVVNMAIPAQVLSQSAPTFTAFISTAALSLIASIASAIGFLLVLIGAIGGELLGLWRVGSRYGEATIKTGVIFMIFPVLDFIAPILVIVGVRGAKRRHFGH